MVKGGDDAESNDYARDNVLAAVARILKYKGNKVD